MRESFNLTGRRFGRLIVLEQVASRDNNRCWKCRCDCGNIIIAKGKLLKNGNVKSCGCLKIDVLTKHGGCGTRIYKIWEDMRSRCYNPNNAQYKYYGGKGIGMSIWINDFAAFRDYSNTIGYADNLEIDRINPDGNYEPGNIRWVTETIQSRNKGMFKNNTSGFKGVRLIKRKNKWRAEIGINGKTQFIGEFDTIEEAVQARKKAEMILWNKDIESTNLLSQIKKKDYSKIYTIYCLTNKINNKKYIGITSKNPYIRWNKGLGYNKGVIHDDINKYDWDGFTHDILLSNLTVIEACKKEIELISEYKTTDKKYGYNAYNINGIKGLTVDEKLELLKSII